MTSVAWYDLTEFHKCSYHRACQIMREPEAPVRIDVCVRAEAWPQRHIEIFVYSNGAGIRVEMSHLGDSNLAPKMRRSFAAFEGMPTAAAIRSVEELLRRDESLIAIALQRRDASPQGTGNGSWHRLPSRDYANRDLPRADDFGKPGAITRSGAFGAKTSHVAVRPRSRNDD